MKEADKHMFGNDKVSYEIVTAAGGGATGRLSGTNGPDWVRREGCPEFLLHADGERLDSLSEGIKALGVRESRTERGAQLVHVRYGLERLQLTVDCFVQLLPGVAVVEKWFAVTNNGDRAVDLTRADSISLHLPGGQYEAMYYTSDWGKEFESVRVLLDGPLLLETRRGRSSRECHPWLTLFRADGEVLSLSAMWSGNWRFRAEPETGGDGWIVNGGLSDWAFAKRLQPGETFESVPVALALGCGHDLNTVSVEMGRAGRAYWYPRNALSAALPVEWNHWWPYVDRYIDETVFLENVEVAAELGVEVCTLDAGWFGPSDPSANWKEHRGDWDLVNTARFPNGIRHLSEAVRAKGMKFGLWCEIEGLGKHAQLAVTHPQLTALRDGERLGYVCFGNPEAQEWAYRTLDRLIIEYVCDWIKLDFNLDPCAGCNRTDHGHGAGDGLYEHYRGYYRVLQRIRETHPHVILENCSSGGLRIDLGLMKQSHNVYLSDPDWPEHGLQIFWGASTMLAPDVCLHWGFCDWQREDVGKVPQQTFNPHDPQLTPKQLDYYIHAGMLGGYGLSQKLPELPLWVKERFARNIRLYKEQIRRFVGNGDVRRLTGQPKRDGRGERWAAFQYTLEREDEHLLFVFRLDRSEGARPIRCVQLDPARLYRLEGLTGQRTQQLTGVQLMEEGLLCEELNEEESLLIRILPAPGTDLE